MRPEAITLGRRPAGRARRGWQRVTVTSRLQVYRRSELQRQVTEFRPQAVGFSHGPEVVDAAKWVKTVCLTASLAGGHSGPSDLVVVASG